MPRFAPRACHVSISGPSASRVYSWDGQTAAMPSAASIAFGLHPLQIPAADLRVLRGDRPEPPHPISTAF